MNHLQKAAAWAALAAACFIVSSVAFLMSGAGGRYADGKHCREMLGGIPVRSDDAGVICIRPDAVLKAYK